MGMATFHLVNFGCRASQADGAALKQQLLRAGLQEASSADASHVAVLNACTVTARADADVRRAIRRIHRANPACRILVTGCYAQRAPEEIARLGGVAWVVGNSHKHALGELLQASLAPETHASCKFVPEGGLASPLPERLVQLPGFGTEPHRPASESARVPENIPARVLVGEISEEFHFAPVFPDDRTRPTLKIQDGCDARCSFCIIPSVRGASRSLPPDKVVEQIRELESADFKEIVLSGINLGSYGRDLGRAITFLGLLERILREASIARIRISSIEPMDVSAELICLAAQEPRLARHFHVPLQSGCDRILRAMNRRYWTRQYAERILAIHEQIPHCGIGADVMVGFPGETDADHQESLRFIESMPFTYLHIFPYSSRPGTAAAERAGQVNGRIAHERGAEIRSSVETKRRAFLDTQVGTSLPALTLDETDGDARVALATNYLKILLPGSDAAPNALVQVRVGRAHGGLLYGYPEASELGRDLPLDRANLHPAI
jgi:threonylcarbamoyladenosine tRNA methylthiotransferase MtaB